MIYICEALILSSAGEASSQFKYYYFLCEQARKLQATLEGCNSKLSLTHWLADGGKV